MNIAINGESVEICEAKTIAELIERYELPPRSVLVEHNGLALHTYEWSKRLLAEGDRIEFIRVVAGG
jgi:thiamine biosynthesis protein ThiS